MRLAILSDIHGNIWALEAVLAAIRKMGDIEMMVNPGDILSGPLEPSATAEILMGLNLPTIAGNHERQLLRCGARPGSASDQYAFEHTSDKQREWLASLPQTLAIRPDILMCHGSPDSDHEYLLDHISSDAVTLDSDAAIQRKLGRHQHSLIICGHSHLPRVYQTTKGNLIVNAGSIGLQAYEDDNPVPHIVENGSPHARFSVCEETRGSWSIANYAIVYDWDKAAMMARKNGRPDWERWLLTGRV